MNRLSSVPKWVVADRGYSSHAFRQHIWDVGARPAIPFKRNEAPVACPDWIYTSRTVVKRLWARLKEWRAATARYEKTAASFMVSSASLQPWIGSGDNRCRVRR